MGTFSEQRHIGHHIPKTTNLLGALSAMIQFYKHDRLWYSNSTFSENGHVTVQSSLRLDANCGGLLVRCGISYQGLAAIVQPRGGLLLKLPPARCRIFPLARWRQRPCPVVAARYQDGHAPKLSVARCHNDPPAC
jgi:hypothetical protein